MKKILQTILWFFARLILQRYNPAVIGVTGSVGKTSTKEAIYAVLATTYDVRRNTKNYNNEIGVPLTIIGSDTGGRSIFSWAGVFLKALMLLLKKDKGYPNMLVLELGADHPGDIQKLARLVKPNVGVVTEVSEAHLEFFENVEGIAHEKAALIRGLQKDGTAVLNYDSKFVHDMKDSTEAEVVFFGISDAADIYAADIALETKDDLPYGTRVTIATDQGNENVVVPSVVGKHLVYPLLAAAAVGRTYTLDIKTIAKGLEKFVPPKGRMRLIDGIKETVLIDDTYNSSPKAALEALGQLAQMPTTGKRYAVLGDMLELGKDSESLHQEVGHKVASLGIDYLFTSGELARDIARGAEKAGMSKDSIFTFKNSSEAGLFLQKRMSQHDVILIKGSQGARMERVTKEVMAQPERAHELLVRQDASWQ